MVTVLSLDCCRLAGGSRTAAGRVRDGLDHEACVARVEAGGGVAEVDRDAAGEAGRQKQDASFPA
jgi:hypothetical protein